MPGAMALRAAERSKLPATRDALAKSSASRAATVAARAVPLKLASLLQPYRKEGRLSLRVERMHQRARLSRGRNNGDGSWSLASDELDDLEYLSPEGIADAQSLSVRIIGLDQDGTTLAIVEVQIQPGAKPPGNTQGAAAAAVAREQDAATQRLHDELASLKAVLVERDIELANARGPGERAEAETSRETLASELAAARESWQRELEQRLADAAARATAALEQTRGNWQAERAALVAKSETRAEDRLTEAQSSWQREAGDSLAKAEAAWKSAETKRAANAETAWREKSAGALAELNARCERAEKALSDARTKAPGKPARDDEENRRLRDEMASFRATLAERDALLIQARAAAEQAQTRLRHEAEAAVSKAITERKAAETARFDAAEAQWHKKSAAELSAMTARCDRAEAALSEARAQAVAAAKSAHDDSEHRLSGELAVLRSAIADRDRALAQARLDAEQSLQRMRQESDTTFAKAQAQWNDEEVARLSAVEAQSRLERALAEMSARCTRAETALAEAQDAAVAKSTLEKSAESRLREELTTARAVLSDRDAALAQTRLTAERALQRVQQESDTALAKAQAGWKAEEAARAAAAEAQWRKQSANALAEATARYKEAETALAQIRVRNGGLGKGDNESVGQLQREIAILQSALAERDGAVLHNRPSPELRETSPSRIAIRENHDWESGEPQEKSTPSPRRLIRDIVIVAALAASAIVLWPRIESYIPPGWLPNSDDGSSTVDTHARAPAPVATPVPPQKTATLIRSANIHSDPTKTAAVVSTLQRGAQVAVIDTRNNWTLVRIDAKGGKQQQGWVYNSFLKDVTDGGKIISPAAHSNSAR
jgi:Bacterial SH3 domain